MAKLGLTLPTYATDNVQSQPDQPIITASALKLVFDQTGIDNKTFLIDDLIAELNASGVANQSGSFRIGHNSADIVADNVGDALEELEDSITTLDGDVVKIDGNQTINDTKTFSTSPVIPVASLSTAPIRKDTYDADQLVQDNNISQNASDISALDTRVSDNETDIGNLQTADTQNVKLTGNQTISGTKTFNTLPQSTPVPSVDADLVNKKYVDDLAPLNIADGSIKNVKLSNDPEDIKNAVYGSFHADADRYVGNTVLAEDGQVTSDWTAVAGALQSDTTNVKIGSQSIKILENDNVAGSLYSTKNNISLDLTELDNGEVSDDSDYIFLPIYISDILALDQVAADALFISLGADAVFSFANRMAYSQTVVGLVTGWNYLKILKSAFTPIGTGSFSNVQSIAFGWRSDVNKINEFVSLQAIQLVKKDPTLSAPNPFQRNGVAEFTINSGEWYVGEEFGKNAIKEIGELSTNTIALLGENSFSDCVISTTDIVDTVNTMPYAGVAKDANNQVVTFVSGSTFGLRSRIGGVNTDVTTTLSFGVGDVVRIDLKKDGINLEAKGYVNGKLQAILTNTTSLDTGELTIGTFAGAGRQILSASITELQHAYHSDIAEVAKTVPVKYQAGAFIADELQYGEFGIDTSNNRLYMKYSSTQVIYFAGVVV